MNPQPFLYIKTDEKKTYITQYVLIHYRVLLGFFHQYLHFFDRMNVNHMFIWIFWLLPASWGELPPPCYSEIFCLAKDTHSLLHVVQMANIHKDSKTFVDKSLKTSPREVLQKFDELMKVCYKN